MPIIVYSERQTGKTTKVLFSCAACDNSCLVVPTIQTRRQIKELIHEYKLPSFPILTWREYMTSGLVGMPDIKNIFIDNLEWCISSYPGVGSIKMVTMNKPKQLDKNCSPIMTKKKLQ